MASAVIATFISRIQNGYDLPMHMDMVGKSERLRGIVEILEKEADTDIAELNSIWVGQYGKRTLPTWADVSNILKIAKKAIADRQAQTAYDQRVARHNLAKQRVIGFALKADEIMRTDIGRLACDQGWQIALHDFVAEHGREPDGVERMNLINASNLAGRRMVVGNDEFTQRLITARTTRMANLRAIAFGEDRKHG